MQKFFLCILAVSILFLSCDKTSEMKREKLTVIYSGNIGGKKDPCGCNPPLGGFASSSSVVKAVTSMYDNVISIVSGAMLY